MADHSVRRSQTYFRAKGSSYHHAPFLELPKILRTDQQSSNLDESQQWCHPVQKAGKSMHRNAARHTHTHTQLLPKSEEKSDLVLALGTAPVIIPHLLNSSCLLEDPTLLDALPYLRWPKL